MKDLPLVLVHGYPFDHTMWFSTIASLGSQARVLCPDLPGFGKEPVLAKKPSMDAYADWLAELARREGFSQVVIAGMSMGGYTALAFAERHPGMTAGLGLISSQTAADTGQAKEARKGMIERLSKEGSSAAAEAVIPKLFGPKCAGNPDFLKYPREGANRAGIDGLAWALKAMAARPDRTRLAQRLDAPVLVLHGLEDQIVPAGKARALAETCKEPILVELPETGHASPIEQPDRVASALARLMAKAHGREAAKKAAQ